MQDLNKAIKHLQKDPVLFKLIKKFGILDYQPNSNYFESLVESIIGQQLSGKAADTIYKRFLNLFPKQKFTHDLVLDIEDLTLRNCGMSWAKARSLHDLSHKILSKTVRLNELDQMSDEEVIIHLTAVKGIGRWTAEMKLMFALQRPDILPLDDVGIQNAMARLYGLNRKSKNFKLQITKISNNWKPHRTLACWYLWKNLDNK